MICVYLMNDNIQRTRLDGRMIFSLYNWSCATHIYTATECVWEWERERDTEREIHIWIQLWLFQDFNAAMNNHGHIQYYGKEFANYYCTNTIAYTLYSNNAQNPIYKSYLLILKHRTGPSHISCPIYKIFIS